MSSVYKHRCDLFIIDSGTRFKTRRMYSDVATRQDLLRGGAKMEIMSWGTHGGLQGRLQQLLDD